MMKRKLYFRAILNVISLILVIGLTDYYLDGVFKYLVYGIYFSVILQYNQKKNLEYEKTKNNNSN